MRRSIFDRCNFGNRSCHLRYFVPLEDTGTFADWLCSRRRIVVEGDLKFDGTIALENSTQDRRWSFCKYGFPLVSEKQYRCRSSKLEGAGGADREI